MTDRDPRDELVDHLPSLRAFARSFTRDASSADDLVQETIVKAWSNMDKYRPGTNLRAWLFTILRNTFYSQTRRAKWEVPDPDGVKAGRLVQKPQQHGALDFADFMVAFQTLPEDQREALILVGASGFSYEEAALVCDTAVGTMKSRVNRARRKLSAILGLEGDEITSEDAATLAVATGTSQL